MLSLFQPSPRTLGFSCFCELNLLAKSQLPRFCVSWISSQESCMCGENQTNQTKPKINQTFFCKFFFGNIFFRQTFFSAIIFEKKFLVAEIFFLFNTIFFWHNFFSQIKLFLAKFIFDEQIFFSKIFFTLTFFFPEKVGSRWSQEPIFKVWSKSGQ